MKTKVNDITDGFGNSWPRCELGKQCGIHVVRPGHAACWCDNAKEEALLLMKENAELRNELARVNGQTMWVCSCGGTDCAGLKENAELLEVVEDMARQHCHRGVADRDYNGQVAGTLVTDSGALSADAKLLRLLAKHQRFRIVAEFKRMVVGYWPENDPQKEAQP